MARALRRSPELKAGCPQQDWGGTATVQPASSRSLTAAKPTDGRIRSTRQVTKRPTRLAGSAIGAPSVQSRPGDWRKAAAAASEPPGALRPCGARKESVVFPRYQDAMAMVKGMLIFGACGYLVLVGVLIVAQRTMLYHPVATHLQPAEASLAQAQEVVLDTSDGEKVIAWHVPPKADKPIVLFFHGNGDFLAGRASRFRELTASGVGLLALSFRGYAGSTGQPTEDGLHRDAMAVYDFAA